MKYTLISLIFLSFACETPQSEDDIQQQKILLERTADSLALVDLYNSTHGAEWDSSWDLDVTMEKWEGVHINDEGRVDSLGLSSRGMNGTIPSSFYKNLTELRVVRLSNNPSLKGSINDLLTNFKNIEYLALVGDTMIEGFIPKSVGDLKNLKTLFLGKTRLSGEIPSEIGDCSSLEFMSAYKTDIEGHLPEIWNKLENLRVLQLNNCPGLDGELPETLGYAGMKVNTTFSIRLDGCNFSGEIPDSWKYLPACTNQILLSNNQIHTKSYEILQMSFNLRKPLGKS